MVWLMMDWGGGGQLEGGDVVIVHTVVLGDVLGEVFWEGSWQDGYEGGLVCLGVHCFRFLVRNFYYR